MWVNENLPRLRKTRKYGALARSIAVAKSPSHLFAGGPFRFEISVEKAYLPEAVMGQVGNCPELVQITYAFTACFCFAHLAFCAAEIFLRAVRLILRRRRGAAVAFAIVILGAEPLSRLSIAAIARLTRPSSIRKAANIVEVSNPILSRNAIPKV
jgi:hypothetical protein